LFVSTVLEVSRHKDIFMVAFVFFKLKDIIIIIILFCLNGVDKHRLNRCQGTCNKYVA